ncbi:hypothetical protein TruAng_003815 [Truncatella angustata]|nr:hypothetical protein TruAng_003815 [Truncatella angustata]
MTTRQLSALLAMPAALRPLLFTTAPATFPVSAHTPAPWGQTRCFHATCRAYARYMKRPLSVGAFTIPHSPTLPMSEISIKDLLESPVPDKSLISELNRLFTQNPATFYHGTSDFYMLKKNTRIPEICILGRSNVGKSTFVNALANRREHELAHTSARAGRTKAMNAFGFGPAPTMKELAEADDEVKRTEDLPTHSFFVLDMPGYGHKSLQDWGKHITLYLNKRQAIKGAILLIDGEVGPKSGDLMALELLQEAGLKTAIVLTKADKARHEEILKKTCREMWTTMRGVQARDLNSKWDWEKDFFVTALGATKKEIGAESVAIARLAVARLAGLVKEKERPDVDPAKGYSGKIVSFDDLQLASKPAPPTWATSTTPSKTPEVLSSTSDFAALEDAAREQQKPRSAFGRELSNTSGRQRRRAASRPTVSAPQTSSAPFAALAGTAKNTNKPRHGPGYSSNGSQTRFLHNSHRSNSQSDRMQTLPGQEPLSSSELKDILKEFAAKLKARSTSAEHARMQHERDHPKNKIWDPTFVPPSDDKRQKRKDDKKKHAAIYEARLQREEIRAIRQAERQRQREEEERQAARQGARRPADSPDVDVMTPEGFAQSWSQIEEARDLKDRVLKGKKAKKAVKDEEKRQRREEKQKKQRKETDGDDEEEDSFAAKFNAAR